MNTLYRPICFVRLKNNRGSMLMAVYLVITVLMILGAAFMALSSNESRASEVQRKATQAFYIAEAGIERVIYDLRQDFVNDASSPSWTDGDINGMAIGPNTSSFYSVPYSAASLNGGSYAVTLKNVSGVDDIWIRSTGSVGNISQAIQVYVRLLNLSPWDNAIFAGRGASGTTVNGNANIRGSAHILGTGLTSGDYAIDLGGTAELVGNNYTGLAADLAAKVPALPTTVFGGETVTTLNAELRVKRGKIGLSGSSTVGEANITGNGDKETINGAFVTDGYGGTQGAGSVYSDNGTSEGYDLGDAVTFPSLNDPYGGYSTYKAYLEANALVISDSADRHTLETITPNSSFSFSSAKGSITMDGNGNMTISGIVYIDDSGKFITYAAGSNKTITYTGSGVILAEGDVQIDTDLVTNGNNSFPTNILGIMTPHNIGFNKANIDVMGLFYAEDSVVIQKQTDVMGTIVSNYINMGTNVPSVFQVPETVNYLPAGMITGNAVWLVKVISWQKI